MTATPEIRLTLKVWEALLVIAAGVAGSFGSNNSGGIGLLCALAAGATFGIWRCVRILGQLPELRQAEVFDEEER